MLPIWNDGFVDSLLMSQCWLPSVKGTRSVA